MAMYYAGCILDHFWADTEIYVPSCQLEPSEIENGMKSFYEGHNYQEAKKDLIPLAEKGYPEAFYALYQTCFLLGQREEADKWRQLDKALNPRYDENPATLFAQAVRGNGSSITLQTLFELIKEWKGTPPFPVSTRLLDIISKWMYDFYQYEGYKGSGYAFYQLSNMYDEANAKKKSQYWMDQACYIGYAPPRRTKYNEIYMREMDHMQSGYVNADDLDLAENYAKYVYDAGIMGAKDDIDTAKVIRRKASRQQSINEKIAAREARNSSAFHEYRR